MEITRRTFSRGLGGLFGGAFAPGGRAAASILPAEPGIDDAYEKLLSEYIRVEEAAIAAGQTSAAQAGAATWEGRQLEGFIAELEGRIDLKATARQIYSEFAERLREQAGKAQARLRERAGRAIEDAVGSDPLQSSDEDSHEVPDMVAKSEEQGPVRETAAPVVELDNAARPCRCPDARVRPNEGCE
jgi:hypothetical protein